MSNPTFRLAADLVLPADTVVRKLAFIGTTDSGKTYNAMKLAEAMWDAGSQFVALDTMGIWYGLRIPADPKGEGIPIPVFGGRHGDLPLSPRDGYLMAEVIVKEKISAVIDVSMFETDADKSRFASDFADRFYRLKQNSPSAIHLFLEEAHEFIPQNVGEGEKMMLHHFNRIWKQGGNYGIGGSIITQRPQDVNKKSSELSAAVFAFNTMGSNALDAMRKWIKTPEVEQLPSLPLGKEAGKCLIHSPGWLKMTNFRRFDPKRTFHVRFDPTLHVAETVTDRSLAAVDIAGLKASFAKEAEEEKANDPKLLKARIKELEKQVGGKSPVVDQAAIDAAVSDATTPLIRQLDVTETILNEAAEIANLMGDAARQLAEYAERLGSVIKIERGVTRITKDTQVRSESARRLIESGRTGSAGVASASTPSLVPSVERKAEPGAKYPADLPQRILNGIATWEMTGVANPSRDLVAFQVNLAPTTKSFGYALSALKADGLIVSPKTDAWALTREGAHQAKADAPKTLDEYHAVWRKRLSALSQRAGHPDKAAEIFDLLLAHRHATFTRKAIADRLGLSMTTKSLSYGFSSLRDFGLIQGTTHGPQTLTELAFPEGLE